MDTRVLLGKVYTSRMSKKNENGVKATAFQEETQMPPLGPLDMLIGSRYNVHAFNSMTPSHSEPNHGNLGSLRPG